MHIDRWRTPALLRLFAAVVAVLGHGDDGIVHVTVRFGYAETPDLPPALRLLDEEDTEGRPPGFDALLTPDHELFPLPRCNYRPVEREG
ncbi:hypothetical protein [Actinoplanes subtropicus]|uniref:hypothetical protein n=1 Tax=Actinoplanes subtropicus TaxID=543632 RepID=UPI0004C419D8|nr:hypothetical protein [Actinoplanes subtropicus]